MVDILSKIAERYVFNVKSERFPLILLISGMVIGVYFLVYFTGGIKYVYSHSMYVPIILSALFFGIRGGVLAGLIGGLVLGPFMPIDVITGEQQKAINWIYRMGFFTLIGAITGASIFALRKRIEEINWLMHNNKYTELPNEQSLTDKLEELTKDNEIKKPYYLLSIGASNVATIKNTFGFSVMPVIIMQMNYRLKECLLFNHGIFNHDIEKMAVILSDVNGISIDGQIQKIVNALELPYEYENIPIHIDIHIGCVVVSDHAIETYTLLRKCETALNHAINDKLAYCIYKEEEDKTSKKNVALLGSLRKAIELNQLVLHFQPKVEISSKKLLGVEALIRWEHPHEGMIPPGSFIPQAEQTNLINPLTNWVLEEAGTCMLKWDKQDFRPTVAINISTRNLNTPEFEDTIYSMLEKYNIPPQRLELEITESALMNNPKKAIQLLTRLADSDITISIDDFGTGYSSLEYLCKLPAKIIKIDQYFVKNVSKDDAIKNIIESAVELAHSLDMTVVAEGVEDENTINYLNETGCDIVQGFFISRPIPENDLFVFSQTH